MSQGEVDNANSSLESKLHAIARATPRANFSVLEPGRLDNLSVNLPHGNVISAVLDHGSNTLAIKAFTVAPDLHKRGIGTRLLRTVTKIAQDEGATSLTGHVTSKDALLTRARVFGQENLVFYDHKTGERLPVTYEDLLQAENPDVDVVVDLSRIDTQAWENAVVEKPASREEAIEVRPEITLDDPDTQDIW